MERHHPLLYLYGASSSTGSDEAAKVRIAYTREKHDHGNEKAEGEWICKVVSVPSLRLGSLLIASVQHEQLRYPHQMFQVSGFPRWYDHLAHRLSK